MAETALATALEKQVWSTEYLKEYTRRSGFKPYMGKDPSSIFVAKYELQEERGKTINIPLITKLGSAGVRGNGVLRGKEEQLGNYNCAISIDYIRNGVVVPKSTQYKTQINLLDAAKPMLRTWSAETLRKEMIAYLGGPIVTTSNIPAFAIYDVDGNIITAAATAANYNTWSAANSDRILYGAATANYSATHATGLANVDATNDKLTTATASLAKRMAKRASPAIRPWQLEDGREYFVMFCGQNSFRDIKADTAMIAANRDSRGREGSAMDNNPIFQDGDLIYDGIIFREVEEITTLLTKSSTFVAAGASSIQVEPVFLCGQGAMGIAWGQEPTPKSDLDEDYQFRPGVAIEELRGIQKLSFPTGTAAAGKQHGLVTVYVSGGDDA